jgi:hypothetical protein
MRRLLALGTLLLTVPVVLIRPHPDGFAGVLTSGQILVAAALGWLLVLVAAVMLVAGRRRRPATAAAVVAFVAAALPPIALVLAVRLIWAGALPRGLLAVATLAPSAVLGLVAWRLARAARDAGSPPPPPPRGWAATAVAIAVAVVVVAFTTAVALIPLTAWANEAFATLATSSVLANADVRLRMLDVARGYRVPPDPSIDLETAGRAYYRVISAADGAGARVSPHHRPAPDPVKRPWEPGRAPWVGDSHALLLRAKSGLTPAEREYTETAMRHPAFAEWTIVARAPALDSFAAAIVLPLPPEMIWWEIPGPLYGAIQGASRVQVARAAVQLGAGRVAEAEATLRDVVGFGVVMGDSATVIEGLIGAAIARNGLLGLQALYEATGRAAEARGIDAALAAVERPHVSSALDVSRLPPEVRRAYTLGTLSASGMHRALRWEMLPGVVFAPCGSVAELLLGARADVARAVARARQDLVRHPGERARFEVLEQTLPRLAAATRRESGWRLLVANVLGGALGDEMLVACGIGLSAASERMPF